MELIQDWRVFHQWLREPSLRAAEAAAVASRAGSAAGEKASEGALLVVVENSESGPIVLACMGAERGETEDFSAALGAPLVDWLDRVGSGRAIHLVEAGKLASMLEDAPADLPFFGQVQWLLGQMKFRELEEGDSLRGGDVPSASSKGPFLRRFLSLPRRAPGIPGRTSVPSERALESLLDGGSESRFLESFSGWARRLLPRSFALMVRLESVSGAVDGRTQALPRDAVFVFKDGELHSAFEPDLSNVGLERRLDLGASIQVLQERWMTPVLGLKTTEAMWLSWVGGGDPWAGVRAALKKGEAQLLPEGAKNPLWLVLQSRKFSL